jgi:TonB-linked SusC/RagA family outer membrane protein
MLVHQVRRRRAILAVVAAILLSSPARAARGQDPASRSTPPSGIVAGRVVDRASNLPVADVQISVADGQRGALTASDGTFRIVGIPSGTVRIRASRLGYGAATQVVEVRAGSTAQADFALDAITLALDAVVVTATGEGQRRRESGASVGQIRMDSAVVLTGVPDFASVLGGRSAGVHVETGSGTSGTGARVRIRGSNSVSLSNDPLLIIDGVRVSAAASSSTISLGGQSPSRINDLNPADIESIEIIKGPAAAALYGTAAANGVIQVTTKRGRAGRTRWNAYAEYGRQRNVSVFPANYAQIGITSGGARTTNCTIDQRTQGLCTPIADSLAIFNPLTAYSPLRVGNRQAYALSASGGGEQATYYVAGTVEREQGVFDPNQLARSNLRANIRAQLAPTIDATITAGYLWSDLQLPLNDNSSYGSLGSGLDGLAFDCSPATPCGADTRSHGYKTGQLPQELFAIQTGQDMRKFVGGVNVNWRPLSWLAAVATVGADIGNRFDYQTVPPGLVVASADMAEGQRRANRFELSTYTANGGLTATLQFNSEWHSTTSVGVQYVREGTLGTQAFGQRLTPGTGSLSGTNALFSVSEETSRNITVGAYAQQQVALGDRLFVNVGLRADRNSAFGSNFGAIVYPSASASWVMSEEPYFHAPAWLSSLRLRAAYGESGQRPGVRDAIEYYTPVAVSMDGVDVPAITLGNPGNVGLEPERSAETEFGVDATLFGDRVSTELTYYDKTTTDALVLRRLAPSLGLTTTRFENLGRVRNRGVEALLRVTPVRTARVTYELTATGSFNRNRVEDLGANIAPIIFGFGSTTRHQNGYPLASFFAKSYTFDDANGDGLIARSEVTFSDTAVFLGASQPTRELSLAHLVSVGPFRLGARLDYRGGYKNQNDTEGFRCATIQNCRGVHDASAPLAEQARAIAYDLGSRAGYIEDASFWKLRDVSATFVAPERWARQAHATGLSISLVGRNLRTWTSYSGFDPEVNSYGQGTFSINDFNTQTPLRTWTARVDLTF